MGSTPHWGRWPISSTSSRRGCARTPRASADLAASAPRAGRPTTTPHARDGPRRCTTSGGSACRRDLGPRRSAHDRAVGTGPAAPVPHRAGAARCRRCARWLMSPAATMSARTAPATTAERRAGELDAAGSSPPPTCYHAMTGTGPIGQPSPRPRRRPSCGRASTTAGSDGSRSTRCWRRRTRADGMRPPNPAGLTDREGRGVAPDRKGRANKQVAAASGSRRRRSAPHRAHLREDRGHHRAGATLFAMEHGLLSPDGHRVNARLSSAGAKRTIEAWQRSRSKHHTPLRALR